MQLMETATAEQLREFVGSEITVANGGQGHAPIMVRGTLMEVIDRDDDSITVKYTSDEYAYGTLRDADIATWKDSHGIATWSGLRAKHTVEDDGSLLFDESTAAGFTAHIVANAA